MEDNVLVLNAGSSSLKFCVYQRPSGEKWRLESRGQIEGIGSSPRMTAKDSHDKRLVDEPLTVQDGREAVDALGDWLKSRYAGSRVVGVGHRVVHGGAKFSGPTIITPEVLHELRALRGLRPSFCHPRLLCSWRRRRAPCRHGAASISSVLCTVRCASSRSGGWRRVKRGICMAMAETGFTRAKIRSI